MEREEELGLPLTFEVRVEVIEDPSRTRVGRERSSSLSGTEPPSRDGAGPWTSLPSACAHE